MNVLDEEEQNSFEKEGLRMLTKSVDGKEDVQKIDDVERLLSRRSLTKRMRCWPTFGQDQEGEVLYESGCKLG